MPDADIDLLFFHSWATISFNKERAERGDDYPAGEQPFQDRSLDGRKVYPRSMDIHRQDMAISRVGRSRHCPDVMPDKSEPYDPGGDAYDDEDTTNDTHYFNDCVRKLTPHKCGEMTVGANASN